EGARQVAGHVHESPARLCGGRDKPISGRPGCQVDRAEGGDAERGNSSVHRLPRIQLIDKTMERDLGMASGWNGDLPRMSPGAVPMKQMHFVPPSSTPPSSG